VTSSRQDSGQRGEAVAASFLRRKGFRILERNFLLRGGELDLICRKGSTLVFVEVRARANLAFGHPLESITAAKRRHLLRAALVYLKKNHWEEQPFRFDLVAILWDERGWPKEITHLENCLEEERMPSKVTR
jgi:putative endonuclease